jgi:hypothetical protein
MNRNGQQRNPCFSEASLKGIDLLSRDGIVDSMMVSAAGAPSYDRLWTPEEVAARLNVSPDWVRDHSGRKEPRLPVIRLGGGPGRAGLLRYRARKIEEFIEEMERQSNRNSRSI